MPQTFCKWVEIKNKNVNFVEVKAKLKPFEEAGQEIILERGETRIRVPLGINQQGLEVVKTLWKILV